MIKIIWQRLPFLFGLLLCLLTAAIAGDTSTTGPKAAKPHGAAGHHDAKKSAKRDWRRHNLDKFRELMRAEIAQMPALNKRMERLGQIQKRRYALQQLRQAAAAQTTTSREAVLKKFHTLLQEDMELSDKARHVASDIVKDMPRIQRQFDARREELNAALKTAEAAELTSASEAKADEVRRRLRYLDYIQDKLDDIKKHPERLDLLSRVLKGLPPEEDRWQWGQRDNNGQARPKHKSDSVSAKNNTDSKSRIQTLRQEKRQLQRRIREIDARIQKLNAEKQDKPHVPKPDKQP